MIAVIRPWLLVVEPVIEAAVGSELSTDVEEVDSSTKVDDAARLVAGSKLSVEEVDTPNGARLKCGVETGVGVEA